ncbi:hypothetical protein [Allobranchiibius sp. GilTou38]|uniref:hypothetical protein n=1 Tax=Allobranchiibius sp. GilTou38 TaxID=2815210 RepID=UPI001AA0FECB|nr:hypothetical protein [Allobranchiibius sp. GilTou38]MBO1765780.1 hypothetical protein [Allobranchiibius sp. GilTou38]
MGRPLIYPPIPEPGFAAEVEKGHRATLAAVLCVLARRLDAGTSTRDLASLAALLQTTARELAAQDGADAASPAAII